MTQRHHSSSQIDQLTHEMDAIDDALAAYLVDLGVGRPDELQCSQRLEFLRLCIKAWCINAARRAAHDADVLAALMMAVDHMDCVDLAALIRCLLERAAQTTRLPAA
jgi:hypothetical protein